ncbi:MAG: 50S ribosomal protein L21 [Lutibacter sp.]
MYAIVEIAGQQFKVAKDQKVFVHRLQEEAGSKVSFDKVLLLDNKGTVSVGAPVIEGAEVTAKILSHLKGDKLIVFKKKRRKGYRVKNGHRQALTEIQIETISATGSKKKAPAKKAAPKKEEAKKADVKKASPKKTSVKADDLKKIEGVGPKAAEAMVNAGLDTFAKVAKADPKKLAEILTEASSRLAHLVTDTWPKQAKLAADGKWDELKELQDRLDGGVEK